MHLLKNRIVISLIVIALLTFVIEFFIKRVSGPYYFAAVSEYKSKNYNRSLELLWQAWNVNPNDTAILTLMGWNFLKLGDAKSAETHFGRAYGLTPDEPDLLLGYAYTEIELGKLEKAKELLGELSEKGGEGVDVHLAWAALYRKLGQNWNAAREFQAALAEDPGNPLAVKNLQEIYNVTGDVTQIPETPAPFARPGELTYHFRAEGDHFARRVGDTWQPVYVVGVDLLPTLPGSFPAQSVTDSALYLEWLNSISALGANSIRLYTILPPAFYRALYEFNSAGSHPPLWLIQGVSFGEPPRDNMLDTDYYQECQQKVRDAVDVIHGQGDVGFIPGRPGGLYNYSVAQWVAGLLVGDTWLSHVVTGNNQLNPELRSFQGTYIEAPSGNPTEIFLAQIIDYAVDYEEKKYNWQHPVAFLNWPTLDPLRHPTESTMLEEVSIRRALGERLRTPPGPYDDDDGVAVDPMRLRAREAFAAGYFVAYSISPYYPDFLNYDPGYQAVQDAEGRNPFLGYLQDLKRYHQGIPLLVADYGIPSSLGIGHFSPAGFSEGGKTEEEQGQLLARFTRNVHSAGAAGGTLLEWIDQWFRQSWIQCKYEVPQDRRILWTNYLDPPQYFGLLAADSHRRSAHLLHGDPAEWENRPPIYTELEPPIFQPVDDRYDPARDLKALYADADEGFLYLRLVVGKLDNDGDARPDWNHANYLIGLATSPERAGLVRLPFIAPIRFPMGMTYAVQLAGAEASRIWIASSYNPYEIRRVEGLPAQTSMGLKLGWRPTVTDAGVFEAQVIEPNRRRFARDGRYFPPQRYDRGALRYGSLDPRDPDYDSLATVDANVRTNMIDLRLPWALVGVTDPSSFQVFAGLQRDGTVETVETPGFTFAVFSYRPRESARSRPIMQQGHPVADALPGMAGPTSVLAAALKPYRWVGWDKPQYSLRLKASYAIVQKAFRGLPRSPVAVERPAKKGAGGARAKR